MKKNRVANVLLGVLICLVMLPVAGCAVKEDHDKAKDAIEEAKSAGGEKYAGNDVISAENALDRGIEYMFFLRYNKASDQFGYAYEMAKQATDKSQLAGMDSTAFKTPELAMAVDGNGFSNGTEGQGDTWYQYSDPCCDPCASQGCGQGKSCLPCASQGCGQGKSCRCVCRAVPCCDPCDPCCDPTSRRSEKKVEGSWDLGGIGSIIFR